MARKHAREDSDSHGEGENSHPAKYRALQNPSSPNNRSHTSPRVLEPTSQTPISSTSSNTLQFDGSRGGVVNLNIHLIPEATTSITIHGGKISIMTASSRNAQSSVSNHESDSSHHSSSNRGVGHCEGPDELSRSSSVAGQPPSHGDRFRDDSDDKTSTEAETEEVENRDVAPEEVALDNEESDQVDHDKDLSDLDLGSVVHDSEGSDDGEQSEDLSDSDPGSEQEFILQQPSGTAPSLLTPESHSNATQDATPPTQAPTPTPQHPPISTSTVIDLDQIQFYHPTAPPIPEPQSPIVISSASESSPPPTHLPPVSHTTTTPYPYQASLPSVIPALPKPIRNPSPPSRRHFYQENFLSLKQRLETLLPQMEAANAALQDAERDGSLEEMNMECLNEGAKAHIEMDLALGVLEEKRERGGGGEGDDEDWGDVWGDDWFVRGKGKKVV